MRQNKQSSRLRGSRSQAQQDMQPGLRRGKLNRSELVQASENLTATSLEKPPLTRRGCLPLHEGRLHAFQGRVCGDHGPHKSLQCADAVFPCLPRLMLSALLFTYLPSECWKETQYYNSTTPAGPCPGPGPDPVPAPAAASPISCYCYCSSLVSPAPAAAAAAAPPPAAAATPPAAAAAVDISTLVLQKRCCQLESRTGDDCLHSQILVFQSFPIHTLIPVPLQEAVATLLHATMKGSFRHYFGHYFGHYSGSTFLEIVL